TEATLEKNGVVIITADHGNCDTMKYPNGEPNKSHTMALVPVIIAGKDVGPQTNKIRGTLADIAPTILKIFGEKLPKEMTGKPLI
ncbi:MAG: 2,3-bisphosphoglycerate-independent phosphoglycerate mutase, partial [Clostridia bacterium]|nr:2,3-bisphosphoglycerate-independent phosphoglycerate mutase [Clostridia bacterium]